jgi:GT2 family glycosyltransferase
MTLPARAFRSPGFESKARIAAVVLNYRTPTETARCVSALQASHRAIDEIIVVENGSGDDSFDILRRALPTVTLIAAERNLGFSGGCNRGIERALTGGAVLVLLVNSDARLHPEALGALERSLSVHQDLGIVGPVVSTTDVPPRIESRGISVSSFTGRVRMKSFGLPLGSSALGLTFVDAVSGCLMLVRRTLFETIGLLSEEYFFSFEDVDFCLRARRAGFRVGCVEEAHAQHEGSLSIGAQSPRRIYFATRNHLLVMHRAAPRLPRSLSVVRQGCVIALNLAHALSGRRSPVLPALRAFADGVRDHLHGHYGSDQR